MYILVTHGQHYFNIKVAKVGPGRNYYFGVMWFDDIPEVMPKVKLVKKFKHRR